MNCDQLILTTQHKLDVPKEEGNLLLDNCSDIQLLPGGKINALRSSISPEEQPSNAGAAGQILLQNPSFETYVYAQQPFPQFWDDKGAKNMTPPDVQPGAHYVTTSSKDGRYYLSMIARVDGTKEAIGQQLSAKMEQGTPYSFSVWLAHSKDFESRTKEGRAAPFTKPILLQIWGINTKTGAKELLAKSIPASTQRWIEYIFKLTPAQSDVDYLILETCHDPKAKTAYNGHFLIDNCSSILKMAKYRDFHRHIMKD